MDMSLPNHYEFEKYTDAELEELLRKAPTHSYRPMVHREQDRRQKIRDEERAAERDRENEKRHKENQTLSSYHDQFPDSD